MYPSDLLGNFYLTPIDRFLEDRRVSSARYVDDIYVFVESVDAADHLLRELLPIFRSYDLIVNEAKSVIMSKSALVTEEPDLEALFDAYAVKHVLEAFKKRPSMSQIYAAYLAQFLETEGVHDFLLDLLKDATLFDWQRMWVLAALSQVEEANDTAVRAALDILRDATRHDALRAVSAIYVGRFGDHTRRRALISIYPSVSGYIQTAIYYSSRSWPAVERTNARSSWGGHSPLHTLLTVAISKK